MVLEAKSEGKQPLVGKKQARRYARSLNCRFVMLSNGNLHYFWDLERGNPHLVTAFPRPESVGAFRKALPNPQRLVEANRKLVERFEKKIQATVGRVWGRDESSHRKN